MVTHATEISTDSVSSTGTTTQVTGTRSYSVAWIVCQIATSFFTIICLYLTFAVIYHKFRVWNQARMRNWNHAFATPTLSVISASATYYNSNNNNINNNNNKSRKNISTSSSTGSGPFRSKSRNRMGAALDILTIAATVLVILRLFSEQLILNLSHLDKYTCNTIADIHVVLYALPIAAIYSFLWLRQRILYSHPPLSLFNSKKVNVVSFAIIVVMVVGELITALVFTLTITYKPGELGCVVDTTLLPKFVPWVMIIFFTGLFQLLLLSLYIVPMIRQRIKQNQDDGVLRLHGTDRVGRAIKRVCAITCTCVASDLLAGLVTIASDGMPVVSNLVYDLNLLVNLVGIICSFKDWRRRLLPFSCFDSKRRTAAISRKRLAEYTSSNESAVSVVRFNNTNHVENA